MVFSSSYLGIFRCNCKVGAEFYFCFSEFSAKISLENRFIRSYILFEQLQVRTMRDLIFWLNFSGGTGFVIMGAAVILLIGVA